MAITEAMCTSFKQEVLEGVHNFKSSGGHTFKIALYTSSASLDATTTAYTTSNEVSGTNYDAGGFTLQTRVRKQQEPLLFVALRMLWNSSSITARGALIYNSSQSNKAVCVLDFGIDKTSNPDFRIDFPAETATGALIRFA